MDLEAYTLAIGKIVINLHSLEFSLRMFLYNHEQPNGTPAMQHVSVGQSVSVDAFSNYDTLGTLIKKFNLVIQPVDPLLMVDLSVVDLRDALAHGRIWAASPQPPMQLVKFDKPLNNQVRVTHALTFDDAWMGSQKTGIYLEIQKVQKAGQTMQPTKWPIA